MTTTKKRYVRRPVFTFKEFDFLNTTLLAAKKGSQVYVDVHRICTALKLSHSSQLARLRKYGIDLNKTSFNKKTVRLITSDSAKWWLGTFDKALINPHARRLIEEYSRALVKEAKFIFGQGPSAYTTETIELSHDLGKCTPQFTSLETYERMEANRKMRDEAIVKLREYEKEVNRLQALIDQDMDFVTARMKPNLDLLFGEFDADTYTSAQNN